jgi:cytochrome c oxidase subunit II
LRRTAALTVFLGLALAVSCGGSPPPPPAGAELAERLGCFACHALHGRGGSIAAPLDGVGGRLSRQELDLILTYPRRLRPGARMPSYAYLPPAERQALADFLEHIK